jgi:hypothetical protein
MSVFLVISISEDVSESLSLEVEGHKERLEKGVSKKQAQQADWQTGRKKGGESGDRVLAAALAGPRGTGTTTGKEALRC